MFKINLFQSFFLASITIFIKSTTFSANAASFEKAFFIDNFDDDIVNSSIYKPIGDTSIVEENGQMIITMDAPGEGVSMSFEGVLEETNWFGFEFEPNGFQIGDSLTINVLETNPILGKFTSLSLVFTQLNPIIRFKAIAPLPNGKTFTQTGALEVPFPENIDGIKGISFDWITTSDGSMNWNVDLRTPGFEPGETIDRRIVTIRDAAKGLGAKEINFVFNGEDDPTLTFNIAAVDPIHPIPESNSTFTLLAFVILNLFIFKQRQKQNNKTN